MTRAGEVALEEGRRCPDPGAVAAEAGAGAGVAVAEARAEAASSLSLSTLSSPASCYSRALEGSKCLGHLLIDWGSCQSPPVLPHFNILTVGKRGQT